MIRFFLLCSFWCFSLALQAQLDTSQSDSIPLRMVITDSSITDSIYLGDNLADSAQVARPKKRKREHSPRTALILAATLPGAGQIYNRKYWKLPIVYGGLGALGYWAFTNGRQYQRYRKAYLYQVDDDPNTVNDIFPNASSNELKSLRDRYQGSLEYAVLGTVIFYALTVTDAFVDAHLMGFDISDDLSMRFAPRFVPVAFGQSWNAQLGLQFHWKKPRAPASFLY